MMHPDTETAGLKPVITTTASPSTRGTARPATADLGIAIGAGTDVAAETADIVLVRSNPLDVLNLIRLSRATFKKTVQNLFWATGYNAVAIPLAAGVLAPLGILLSPAVGAVLMSLSTVIVAINAKILKLE